MSDTPPEKATAWVRCDRTGESATDTDARTALWLIRLTILYNTIEAGVAVWSGLVAGSIALIGFGLDSVIETTAAALLLWRLSVEAGGADRDTIEATERRAERFVGLTFVLLAVYVIGQSGWTLWQRNAPEESLVGIALAVLSLFVMPALAWGKIRSARRLGSRALEAEAKETLACCYLSLTLLAGLGFNAWLGWWWADPAAALLMVPWLVHEGREGLRGEEACRE